MTKAILKKTGEVVDLEEVDNGVAFLDAGHDHFALPIEEIEIKEDK